jgi:DNA primase large subunit
MVPLQWGETGLRKRMSFVKKGNVYMNIECMTDLILNLFCSHLKATLEKMRVKVVDLLDNDVENQMSGFIRKTLDTLNTSNYDENLITNQFKLTIKNVEGLWKRFFPPCMLNLTSKLKQNGHLKHEGRRQLWLFLKGCGMDVHDNK